MEQTGEEFFHDFRQELLAGAEANGRYSASAIRHLTGVAGCFPGA